MGLLSPREGVTWRRDYGIGRRRRLAGHASRLSTGCPDPGRAGRRLRCRLLLRLVGHAGADACGQRRLDHRGAARLPGATMPVLPPRTAGTHTVDHGSRTHPDLRRRRRFAAGVGVACRSAATTTLAHCPCHHPVGGDPAGHDRPGRVAHAHSRRTHVPEAALGARRRRVGAADRGAGRTHRARARTAPGSACWRCWCGSAVPSTAASRSNPGWPVCPHRA